MRGHFSDITRCICLIFHTLNVASLSGRPFCCLAAITALCPWLVPCFAYHVPVGAPFLLSCCYHGTAPKACTVLCLSRHFGTQFGHILTITVLCPRTCTMLCLSRPCRDALSVVLPLSRHCAHGLYRVLHIASLTGRPIGCHTGIMSASRQGRDLA